jgi:hypothetical protein
MKLALAFPSLLLLAVAALATAQDGPPPESRADFRYSFAAIDDATFDSSLQPPLPASAAALKAPSVTYFQNQLLLEPSFTLRYRSRWSVAASMVGRAETFHGLSASDFNLPPGNTAAASALNTALETYIGTHTQLRVKEIYAGLSAGDFDFTAGRKIVRWGTGYAFSPAGVLDPPRTPANPTDRLNFNQGRDMVKADWVHGPHALSLAWSSATLAPGGSGLRDTTAFRYNVLAHGFDTSMIAGNDRGGDSFGGLTFTRVFGQAWELHGEAVWREHEAILLGAKCTTARGVSFIGEFYTPPNIPYYRDSTITALDGRQYYGFLRVSKSRLRELPGWKQWDISAAMVTNMNDHSYTVILDATRRFGGHVSSYLHVETPQGKKSSDYGAIPYTAATSAGVKFQL